MRGEKEEGMGVKWWGGPAGGMWTARAGEGRELSGKDGGWKAGRGKRTPPRAGERKNTRVIRAKREQSRVTKQL